VFGGFFQRAEALCSLRNFYLNYGTNRYRQYRLGYSKGMMNDRSHLDSPQEEIDVIRFTRQLCEIESTTYHEGAVGDFLADFLARRGWDVEKTPVEQPSENAGGGPRWNIYAGKASETPDLVFSTHMDTVPPYIPFSEDDDFLYGRGVCDAKGILAAEVAAAESLREAGYKIGLLFVSGEERDSAGAKAANLKPKGNRFLINGEPTDNQVAVASKGALRVSLKTTGKIAHSAYPELGESAVHKMVELLAKLLKMDWPVDEYAGDTTLNIGQIQGGVAPNVVADHAEAQVLIRLVTDSAPVRERILEAAKGVAEVEFTLDLAFVRLKAVEGMPTMVAKFATDIPQLSNWGQPLLFGPGSIHVAHTPQEKVAKKEIKGAVELYIKVAKQLLGNR
jgi:acetylornithine deacetylase